MKRIGTILRLLITALLLLYVLKKAGFFDPTSRAALFDMILSVSLPLLLLSFVVSLLLNLSSAYKWYLLLRSKKLSVSFFTSWSLYMVGIFFSLMLPTSMGGDLIRLHELGKITGKRAEAAASVFVERFSGMIVLFFLTFISVFMQRQLLSVSWMVLSLFVAIAASTGIVWIIIDDRPYHFVTAVLQNRFPFLTKIVSKIDSLHAAIAAYKDNRIALVIALLNTLLFYLLAVVNVYVTASAFNSDIAFLPLLTAVPLIMFIMNLPISIGGIGLMEFAFVFIFEMSGYSSGLALSTALLMRFKSFVDAGMGGILYAMISGKTGKAEVLNGAED